METSQTHHMAFKRHGNTPHSQVSGAQYPWISSYDLNIPKYQTSWSLAPFLYPTSNQLCMCFRYGSVSTCYCKDESWKQDDNPGKATKLEAKQPHVATKKVLNFGIDKILTNNDSDETRTDPQRIEKTSNNLIYQKEITMGSRRRNGTRSVFSHFQRNILESYYQRREYVTKGERYHIALEVGISEEQVKIWFQNRRTKKKKIEANKRQCEKTYGKQIFSNTTT